MSEHGRLMDADGYWRQFTTPFYFDTEGDQLVGTVLELVNARKDEPPAIRVQTPEGRVHLLTARQARLQFELVKAAPAVGDKVRITYKGEAARAAPGMNKAKEFTVEVWRQGSGSQTKASVGTSGESDAMDGQSGGRK